jgi:hypothetical protein
MFERAFPADLARNTLALEARNEATGERQGLADLAQSGLVLTASRRPEPTPSRPLALDHKENCPRQTPVRTCSTVASTECAVESKTCFSSAPRFSNAP